jgi:hypothetical protein
MNRFYRNKKMQKDYCMEWRLQSKFDLWSNDRMTIESLSIVKKSIVQAGGSDERFSFFYLRV